MGRQVARRKPSAPTWWTVKGDLIHRCALAAVLKLRASKMQPASMRMNQFSCMKRDGWRTSLRVHLAAT